MKYQSFYDYIWHSLLSLGVLVFTLIASAVSMLAYYITDDYTVSFKYLTAGGFLAFALVSIALKTAHNIFKDFKSYQSVTSEKLESINRSKVISATEPPKSYGESIAALFTEPNENLANDSIVTIYLLQNDFEELVAIGKVINVQSNKKIQISVLFDYDFSKHKQKIMNNDKEILEKIVIKPTIPSFILSGDYNFE